MLVKPRWLFLKVHTDEGIVGWGEPITEGRATLHEMGLRMMLLACRARYGAKCVKRVGNVRPQMLGPWSAHKRVKAISRWLSEATQPEGKSYAT